VDSEAQAHSEFGENTMMEIRPCRAEAAAVMLESLADDSGSAKLRAETVCRLLDIPLTHPMRWTPMEREGSAVWEDDGGLGLRSQRVMVDLALDYAECLRHGESVTHRLREWAAEIRAGAAEMRATGWYPIVCGGAE
jgi:hypothetical protein